MDKKLSNCLIHVLKKYWNEGGYIIGRKSKYGWWPHFFHVADNGVVTEFIPLVPKPNDRKFPRVLFWGKVIISNEVMVKLKNG